jgi:hypothetical protein
MGPPRTGSLSLENTAYGTDEVSIVLEKFY